MPASIVLTPPQMRVLRYVLTHAPAATADIAAGVYGNAALGVANTTKALAVLGARKLVRQPRAGMWAPTAAARRVSA